LQIKKRKVFSELPNVSPQVGSLTGFADKEEESVFRVAKCKSVSGVIDRFTKYQLHLRMETLAD
jgi:hypothetical protein